MDINIKCHFIDGAFIEITGDEKNNKIYKEYLH